MSCADLLGLDIDVGSVAPPPSPAAEAAPAAAAAAAVPGHPPPPPAAGAGAGAGAGDFKSYTYYTAYGEISFAGQPKPKIVFHNPRAQKTDITCYPSTLRQLINSLLVAQDLCKKFNEMRESHPNSVDEALVHFKNQVAPFEPHTAGAAAAKDQSLIYYKELTEYGDQIKMKLTLSAHVYKNKTNIWLKPMWKNPEAQEGTNPWRPTLRGFQFSIYDDPHEIMQFADRHYSAWAAAAAAAAPPPS